MEHERVLKAQVTDLKAKLQRAEDRVYVLEQALGVGGEGELMLLGLRGSEAVLLSVLRRRPIASRQQLHTALYIDRTDGGENRDPRIVDTYLVYLRKKLAPHGIHIKNIYDQGWTLGADGRAKIADLLAAARLI